MCGFDFLLFAKTLDFDFCDVGQWVVELWVDFDDFEAGGDGSKNVAVRGELLLYLDVLGDSPVSISHLELRISEFSPDVRV